MSEHAPGEGQVCFLQMSATAGAAAPVSQNLQLPKSYKQVVAKKVAPSFREAANITEVPAHQPGPDEVHLYRNTSYMLVHASLIHHCNLANCRLSLAASRLHHAMMQKSCSLTQHYMAMIFKIAQESSGCLKEASAKPEAYCMPWNTSATSH